MKFLLKDIELNLEDELIEQGETLIEQKQMLSLTEIEKNLWLARFKEIPAVEVELQLKAKRIQDCTCDCKQFHKTKPCSHVVATLLALRNKIKEREAERKAKRALKATKTPNRAAKLTPHNILASISHEELKAFVKRYASSNRQFALSLKAKFARKVYHPDVNEKYRTILDSAINAHLRSNKKFSNTVIRQISTIIEALYVQLEDALSLSDFTEVFAIIQVSFEKVYPLIRRAPVKNNPFLQLLKENLDYFEQLILQATAPDFKTQLWNFGLEEMQKNNYLRFHLSSNWYQVMGQLANESIQLNQLLDVLKIQLESDQIHETLYNELLVIQMNLHEQNGDQAAINLIIQENLEKPEILFAAVQDALKKKDVKKAEQLALKALQHATQIALKNELEEILLQIALKQKRKKTIKEFAKKRFLSSYDLKYLDLLKEYQGKTWQKTFAQLMKDLENQKFSLAQRDAIAKLYFHEKMPLELMAFIQKIRSIDLLQRYDQFLIEHNKAASYKLYEELLDQYLQFHLGRKTAQKIRAVFFHLEKISATDLKRKLLSKYRKNYRERHSLIEELADF